MNPRVKVGHVRFRIEVRCGTGLWLALAIERALKPLPERPASRWIET